MNNELSGMVTTYCSLVERGKPAALISVSNKHLREVLNISEQYNVRTYFTDVNCEWVEFWIFKHEHILDVIKSLPNQPKSTFDHWVLGKLFDYDEQSISDFIKTRL